MLPHHITTKGITIAELDAIVREGSHIALGPDAAAAVERSHQWLQRKLAESNDAIYGVNTGFGALADTRIDKKDLATLQRNLVMSHACGSGAPISADRVRAMLVLKVQSLAFGHSGVAPATVQRLIDMHNMDMLTLFFKLFALPT